MSERAINISTRPIFWTPPGYVCFIEVDGLTAFGQKAREVCFYSPESDYVFYLDCPEKSSINDIRRRNPKILRTQVTIEEEMDSKALEKREREAEEGRLKRIAAIRKSNEKYLQNRAKE